MGSSLNSRRRYLCLAQERVEAFVVVPFVVLSSARYHQTGRENVDMVSVSSFWETSRLWVPAEAEMLPLHVFEKVLGLVGISPDWFSSMWVSASTPRSKLMPPLVTDFSVQRLQSLLVLVDDCGLDVIHTTRIVYEHHQQSLL